MAAESVLSHKAGPLPTWGWLAIITGAFGAYYLYSRNSSSSGTTSAASVPSYVVRINNQLPPEQGPPIPREPRPRHHRPPVDRGPHHLRHGHKNGGGGSGPPTWQGGHKGVQVKVGSHGRAPSLREVARRYHTTPARIVKSSEGAGNPHGSAFRSYVKRHDWNAPLPHGTNLDIYPG